MIRLFAPDPARYEAWAACLKEYDNGPIDGSSYSAGSVPEPTPEEFAAYLDRCRLAEDPNAPTAPDRVHSHYFWVVGQTWESDGQILGFLACRWALTAFLLERGGHIGYSVRPSARRRGVASAALAKGVDFAHDLGIRPILVTCDRDNTGSRRTIENNGGVLDPHSDDVLRFWIGDEPRPAGSTQEPTFSH